MTDSSRMIMVVTRFTKRPVFRAYTKTLFDKRDEWLSQCDLCLAIHGPEVSGDADDQIVNRFCDGPRVKILDLRGLTDGHFGSLVVPIFEWALERGYAYIGLTDDDGFYRHPVKSVIDYRTAFASEPRAGVLGPMGPLRKHWRFNDAPAFMELLDHNPWTTLGSQIYRSEALRQVPLDWTAQQAFRMDSPLCMLLHQYGWNTYEMDIDYAHTVSGGLERPKHDADFYQMMLRASEVDMARMRNLLIHPYPVDHVFASGRTRSFYERELRKLETTIMRYHTKKLEKARAEAAA